MPCPRWLLLPLACAATCTEETLFFSAWAADYPQRALALYNPTSAAVALDAYALASCFNGCDAAGAVDHLDAFAGDAIASGGVYAICQAGQGLACAEETQYLSNGNDAFFLVRRRGACPPGSDAPLVREEGGANSTCYDFVDAVGNFSVAAPASGAWSVCGGAATTASGVVERVAARCCGNGGDWAESVAAGASCEWESSTRTAQEIASAHDAACSAGPAPSPAPTPPAPTTPPEVAPPGECPAAPAELEDRRRDKSRLKIAQFNVDWFARRRSRPPPALPRG